MSARPPSWPSTTGPTACRAASRASSRTSRTWSASTSAATALSGSIPASLGSLAGLQHLWLDANQLTGGIPAALGSLANLQRLQLDANQLSGGIPAAVGSLAALRYCYFNDNLLAGPIPGQPINLTNLLNNASNLCGNNLSTSDGTLRDFLNTKQIGGDWEACQAVPVPSAPAGALALLLLAGSGLWLLRSGVA